MKYHSLPYELKGWVMYLVSKILMPIGMAIRYGCYKRTCSALGEMPLS